MTFLQALYGSQYKELKESGRDTAKGRMNGNIFLAAFIIVIVIILAVAYIKLMPSGTFDSHSSHSLSGKSMGKLLAIPVFALIYFAVANTVGTQANYERLIGEFNRLPEEEQAKANKQLLIPFFIGLAIMLVLMLV